MHFTFYQFLVIAMIALPMENLDPVSSIQNFEALSVVLPGKKWPLIFFWYARQRTGHPGNSNEIIPTQSFQTIVWEANHFDVLATSRVNKQFFAFKQHCLRETWFASYKPNEMQRNLKEFNGRTKQFRLETKANGKNWHSIEIQFAMWF